MVFVRTTPPAAPLQAKEDTDGSPRLNYLKIRNRVAPENVPDAERLFGRYYRHPNSIAMPRIGIGLHLVRIAADHIGGTVDYRLENGGAVFEVRIPN